MEDKINLWHDHKSAGTGKREDDFQPYLELSLLPDTQVPLGAVIVLPGGGYRSRAAHEGMIVARKFNELGYHAFVLQYRVAPYVYPAPQLDALRAVALVRSRAAAWQIDPNCIAIGGFSAGGHLACSAGTIALDLKVSAGDEADQVSGRPNALLLFYPVISGKKGITHEGSMINLSGLAEPPEKFRALASLEDQIKEDTPPAFLWHTATDQAVNVENSIGFARNMWASGKQAELHVFPEGSHGLGLAADRTDICHWPELAANFLETLGFPRKKS